MQNVMLEADRYTRGSPRKAQLQWNLSDVARDVILDLIDELDWSQRQLAAAIGEERSTLCRFLSGVHGEEPPDGKIALISKVCARFNLTPMDFFQRHPVFALQREGNPQHLREITARSPLWLHARPPVWEPSEPE